MREYRVDFKKTEIETQCDRKSAVRGQKCFWLFYSLILVLVNACAGPVSDFLDVMDARSRVNWTGNINIIISGLSGTGLRINLGNEIIVVNANGSYSSATSWSSGQNYSASIVQFPSSPSQFCTVNPASGIVGSTVPVIRIDCVAGNAAGMLVGGSIIHALSLTGDADVLLGQVFAGAIGSSGTTDATGNAARFTAPNQLVTDGSYLYVVESAGNVRRIDIATRQVTTIGNIGGSDGIATDGTNLYATNKSDCTVRKMRLSDFATSLVAGSAFACSFADAPAGPGSAARFYGPSGITTDGTYLYVADYTNNRIRRIEPFTGVTITIAGTGTAGLLDTAGSSAQLNQPDGVTYYSGKLYVADMLNYRVRTVDLNSGNFTMATLSGSTWGNTDGAAGTAQFKKPHQIAIDGSYGYVTDEDTHSIRRVDLQTGYTTTLSGWETRTTSVVGTGGGLAGTAAFRDLYGITSDGKNLFVTDSLDQVVRRIE